MSDSETKLAVLIEKVNNMEDNILHKLRNNEQQLKYVYDDINDIQNKLKYIAIGAATAFGLAQGGMVDVLKGIVG